MAITIVSTPGAANANSYQEISEIDAYCESHLFASGWNSMGEEDKKRIAIMTTRFLDVMPGAWNGAAASETQALGHPRTGLTTRNGYPLDSTIIAKDLKNAHAEWCRQIASNSSDDPSETNEVLKQGITKFKAGPIEIGFKQPLSQEEIALPSTRALSAFVPDAVRLMIPPSWLIPISEQKESEGVGLIFEVF